MFRTLTFGALGSGLFVAALMLGIAGGGREATALNNCATTSEAMTAAELSVVEALNAYRQQNGLAPVKVSANLSRAAAFITEDMQAKGYWSHFEPSGRDPFQRAVDCGYPNRGVGENLARSSGPGVVALWKTSPGHNENMLRAQWKVAGVASAGTYWALVLGATDDSGSSAAPGTTTSSPTASPTPTPTPTPGPKDPSLIPIRRALLQMIAAE